MAEEKPLWLETIHRLERAVGEQVESIVRSDAYFDLVTQANRARARVTDKVEGWSREWLHLFNLPANTDIRGMQEQLARMERRLVALRKEIAELEEDGTRPSARQTTAKPRQRREKAPQTEGKPRRRATKAPPAPAEQSPEPPAGPAPPD
jgi:TolA-binding protein